MEVNSNYLEKIILKGMLSDKNFLTLISSVYRTEYFDDPNIKQIFDFCKGYLEIYGAVPSKDIIINSSDDEEVIEEIKETIDNAQELEFDVSQNYDFLVKNSNEYLKEKAIKFAIAESLDDIENPQRIGKIRERVEQALTKDIQVDLGLNYFEQLGERLRRIFTTTENRIPTYFPIFDELINGGFPPLTFNVLTAKIHGGKSNTMANFAARQVLHGHNVVVFSMEMSQDAFAQRFDGIYSCLDINRMYISREYKKKLMRKLKGVKRNCENLGNLFIKQYPTGAASILDLRIYLRELVLRDIKPEIIYVDYINLMKSAYHNENNMYIVIKSVSEELRALSFEFECPVVSVSQLNREGFFTNFNELQFSHIAESMGIPATADFMAILGIDEEQMAYENEILYNIIKSRIGGRVGTVERFYLDKRSLKMYDASELDLWIEEATESGDSRAEINQDEVQERRESRRSRRSRRND